MDRIWQKSYPKGVPPEIDTSVYSSAVDIFTTACTKFADQPAINNFGVSLSYRELDQLSLAFATYLQQDLGLKKGDRVAIMLPNLLQYHVAMFGILRAGLVVVNVNPLYTAQELLHQLTDAGVTTIVVLANFARTVQEALPQTPLKHVIVTEMGDLFGAPKKQLMNFIVRYIKRLVPKFNLPQHIKFSLAITLGQKKTLEAVELNSEDIACLQYTGGTTGISKGAILTHQNIVANTLQAYTWITACGLVEGEEKIIMPLPLYHIFSMTVCALCFIKLGASGILVTNPRDIPGFLKLLKKTPFTAFVGINTLYNVLLHRPEFDEIDFSKFKFAVTGGMALQEKVANLWHEKTGVKILEGYGLTETSPIVTINPPGEAVFSGSIGFPVPSTDITFKSEGADVPIGEEGELCVKGPQVMQGYWKNDAETALVFTEDGYLRTGDIGRVDERGLVYLVDRKKDMILVSGFNVYPQEIESILTMHIKVNEAGVIGVASERTGEMVKAFVVKEDDTLTVEELTEHCRQHLTNYKIPKSIVFVEDLPKSNIGKVLRRELRSN